MAAAAGVVRAPAGVSLACRLVLPWLVPSWFVLAPFVLAPVARAAGPPDVASRLDPACDAARFRIALDVGHSRANPGSTSARGVPEFEYNLHLAQAVSAALAGAGFTSHVLIGAAGTAISLDERTRLARREGARLFLSLHHDSVQPHYLQDWQVDGVPRRYSDRFRGYSVFISDSNRQARASAAFAALLGEGLLREGLTPSLHHAEPIPGEGRPLLDARIGLYRFDGLAVLRTAEMPAVLLEAAVIVHRAEEQQVRGGHVARRVATAVVGAVRRFCEAQAGRSAPGGPASGAPP